MPDSRVSGACPWSWSRSQYWLRVLLLCTAHSALLVEQTARMGTLHGGGASPADQPGARRAGHRIAVLERSSLRGSLRLRGGHGKDGGTAVEAFLSQAGLATHAAAFAREGIQVELGQTPRAEERSTRQRRAQEPPNQRALGAQTAGACRALLTRRRAARAAARRSGTWPSSTARISRSSG